ncbi:hypothetical protein A2773_00250 [Candidatus Gottesmanbacteria bacterium RIFCSPHIGHO2_01_FULL_39_10]|uniref:Dihydroorotate dehydrogenase n=1 Tax=Candidatus Gottesmanbacteria bacterium RIFCSPHIGHO2_01_FULL_39_10 TaxID=1798375 RepID=A0A1F5ZKK0_9BACT|nr:MAG: hypothetical protein A2773_00250 [Candidatus Gottesmanbacteria bacterium RIFCSPHIGHO2_01_FULL_39_10]
MTNLATTFCSITFPNPFILPSGIITEIPAHKKAEESGAGGITTKSLTVEKREGYPIPRIIRFDQGFLNSVGFRGPGIKAGKDQVKNLIKSVKVPVIASIFSTRLTEIEILAKEIASISPSLIELDISCPHVEDEYSKALAMGEKTAYEAVKVAKKEVGKIPLIIKLSPNYSQVAQVAKACEEAGADAISAINTVGPGMIIDIKTKKPLLGNKRGGVSGPAILPIAVRCVYDIYESVKIPIIGIGGVTTLEDVLQMFMAGATLVGVGSATYTKGMKVFEELKQGLADYMAKENIKSLKDIIGIAHK